MKISTRTLLSDSWASLPDMVINLLSLVAIGIITLGVVALLRRRESRNGWYLNAP
jgi:hypothetical protein